ncbi:IclR family transcriptional regulator [Saccharomonospora sp. NPDC006951]
MSTSSRGVAVKVCAILDALCESPSGLTASEIARHTGMPVSTAHRLVRTLAEWGGLERQEGGRYLPGLRLWEVASSAPRAGGLRDTVRPYLEDLYEATGQNVQLAVRDGAEVLVVEHFATRTAIATATRIGGRLPLHASGVGQVLLAFSPPEEQERVLAGPLERFTDRTLSDPAALRAVLADVRRSGVAVTNSSMPLPALAVAAPITDGARCVAAMAVVVPSELTATPYAAAVVAAARGASRAVASGGPAVR